MEYILNNQTEIFSSVFYATIISLVILELLIPLRDNIGERLWIRWFNNIFIGGLNNFLVRFLFPVSTIAIALWAEDNKLGLFNNISLPLAIKIIFSFLIIDLVGYLFHRALHSYSLFWKFHLVHHSDVIVDVTTSVRHHPVELLISITLTAVVIILLGAPVIFLLIYELVRLFVSIFSHSNIRLPRSFDRILSRIIVTPDFHRIHHSADKANTNSNYSSVISWWDYMFSTYQPHDKNQESMQLGLEYFRSDRDQFVDGLLTQPFRYSKVKGNIES